MHFRPKSAQGYVLTVVDRRSRLVRLRKADGLKPLYIHRLTLKAIGGLHVLSVTNDNGVEFKDHSRTARTLGVPIYFTRPYASWERGTVENTDKLIRQYFPKNLDLKEIELQ